ncbi:hypothetical protein [Azospirillum largimobile]
MMELNGQVRTIAHRHLPRETFHPNGTYIRVSHSRIPLYWYVFLWIAIDGGVCRRAGTGMASRTGRSQPRTH